MTISFEEKQAALKLGADIADIKVRAFNMMREFNRMDATALSHTGHKTKEAAWAYTLNNALKDIDRLDREFLRRFPD